MAVLGDVLLNAPMWKMMETYGGWWQRTVGYVWAWWAPAAPVTADSWDSRCVLSLQQSTAPDDHIPKIMLLYLKISAEYSKDWNRSQSVQTWLLCSSYSIILNVWQLIAKLTLVLDLNFEMKLSMQDCCERIKVKCFKNMTFFFFSLKILQSVVFMHNLIFSCKQALTE